MFVYCVVMPRAITLEEREKIIKHKQNNENETDIAVTFFTHVGFSGHSKLNI